MPQISGQELRSIARTLRERREVPDGLSNFDWRFVEDPADRLRLNEQEGAPAHHRAEDATTAVLNFEEGPVVRFTHDGVEYEAAWDRGHRVVAYRELTGRGGSS